MGSGYFASRGKIAPCYFAIWRQTGPSGYLAASAKIAHKPNPNPNSNPNPNPNSNPSPNPNPNRGKTLFCL